MADVTKEIIRLTKEMVRFETTKDRQDELARCAEYVKKYFEGTGFVIRQFERGGKPSLLIGFKKTLRPQLLLFGHLDVVEGKKEQFTAVQKGDRLYGRGTDDMKGQDAVLMVLMRRLAESGEKRNVMLGLTSDEEIGGQDGAKLLVEKGLRPEIVLAPDGGDDMGIVTKEKGILHIKLGFKGKAAHGSRPWLGENAIDKAIEAYQEIKKHFPPTTPKNRWKNTCNIGIFNGGEAPNKVADWAELALDFRYVSGTTEKKLMDMVRKAAKADITKISSGAPLDIPAGNPWIRRFRECSRAVLGKPLRFDRAHGASDVRHFAEAGIPGFLCCVPGENAHGPDEYMKTDRIRPYYQVLERFVLAHVDRL